MKWNDMHSIVDKLSRQTSVKSLNNLGINYCIEYLTGLDYRLYLLEKTVDGNIFDVIAHDGSAKPTEFEVKLTNEIAQTGVYKKRFVSHDNVSYFAIGADRRCFSLVVVNLSGDNVSPAIHDILKTIITVWNNQLSTLYHFQRDYLTGLFNREYFMNTLNSGNFEESSGDFTFMPSHFDNDSRKAGFGSESNALLIIDVENFIDINRRYGYSIGDEILIHMGHLIELSFRNIDMYARFDGDKFSVFIHQISEDDLNNVVDRFLQQTNEAHFPIVDRLNVTIGYTFIEEDKLAIETVGNALLALDKAKEQKIKSKMYNAKEFSKIKNIEIEIGDIELF